VIVNFFNFDNIEVNLKLSESMKNNHLLNYFSQQVNLYLDDRLNDESKESLMKVVDQDDQCCQLFNKEKNFRDFVKNNVKRSNVPNQLIDDIRNKLV
jgi:hypothetical protein